MLEVSYIGDVADVAHLVTQVFEQLHEDIVSHTRTGMSQMCVAIDGRTADIKSYVAFVDGLEYLFLSRKGIGYI